MKTIRVLVALVLLSGVALTGRALYVRAKAELAEVLIHRAWEQSLQSGGASCRPWPWADTYPVARLQIPRLEYDEMVLEGATPRTLAFGPARMQSGAGLGEPGNLLLAGHRTSWFQPLQGIAQGDKIEVEWFDARRGVLRQQTYTVVTIRVVDPDDVKLLEPTAESALTLVTCYPFGRSPSSPQRYVVRAEPAGASRILQDAAKLISNSELAAGRSR